MTNQEQKVKKIRLEIEKKKDNLNKFIISIIKKENNKITTIITQEKIGLMIKEIIELQKKANKKNSFVIQDRIKKSRPK